MLVFLKAPMGILDIDGYIVRGRKYSYGSFGPTDIPLELYRQNKDKLDNAVYTKVWLESKYGRTFPDITFDAGLNIPDAALKQIAELVGVKVTYNKRHELSVLERNALKRSIILFLSD